MAIEDAPSPSLAPLTLVDLLDERSRRLLADAERTLGLSVHIAGLDGAIVVGELVPSVVRAARAELLLFADGLGNAWFARQLPIHGRPAGLLVIGPFAEPREEAMWPVATHLSALIDDLLWVATERAQVARRHSAQLLSAYEELQQKNARLAQAVARLEELDKAKSNFLATVSHELRTPLTSVIGYSEMLLEGLAGPLNSEQREYVNTVMEKADQLLGIITGILDISRIEAGGVQLNCSRFDVGDAIVNALSTVAPAARRKHLIVEAELPPSLPPILADRDKVRQVMVNLISNAVKFTREGGRVTIEAQVAPLRRASEGEALGGVPNEKTPLGLRVAVTDSGIGIPPASLARIFDPFFQVDSSSTREFGGTGLGLSIVRSFVTAHGGTVWVDSSPGRGSTFFATFPLAD